MKNMKKLLAAMTALGFTTVAAVNVVACNPNSGEKSNDLTKSFNASYDTTALSEAELSSWGLEFASSKEPEFSFASIKSGNLTAIIKPIADAKVTVVTEEKDVKQFPAATKVGQELAQITQNTPDGKVKKIGDNETITLKFTLKLWKDNGTEAKTGEWVEQSAKMDVAINIVTKKIVG